MKEEKLKLEKAKKLFEEEKKKKEELEKEKNEEKKKVEEEKRIKEEIKREEKEKKIKEEIEKERKKLKEEKEQLEEEKRKIEEQKIKYEEKKRLEEKIKKEELEKENENENEINSLINKKRDSISIKGKNISNNQSELISNKEISENSSTILKKIKTFKESEILEQEELIINESVNDEIIKIKNKNNFTNEIEIDEKNINNFKKIYDKEISNKIKYELEKDLINLQKKSYNIMKMPELNNKSKDKIINNNNLLELNTDRKRNKLTLVDLEINNNKRIKEIDQLFKGGIDENKLKQLENIYNNNKEIMNIINIYKNQKLSLEKGFDLLEEPLSDLKTIKSDQNKIKYNNKYYNGNKNNKTSLSFQNYIDISNENQLSKNIINNNISQEKIIQNKIKIFKDKMYKPFLDKIEKEKNLEKKRIEILKNINDINIKNSLETKFGIERGKIDLELTKEKKKINNAIKQYEIQLIMNENENLKIIESKNTFY